MSRTTSRLSILALTLGLLLITPLVASAELDPSGTGYPEYSYAATVGDPSGHRSYQDDPEATADYAALEVTRLSLLDELAADGELSVDAIKFIEENVFELEVAEITFDPASVPTIEDEIKEMFDTDHVTVEMIEFYEQNVWY